jgi:(p)ppGpp synthase/HD superfamily hydrolase
MSAYSEAAYHALLDKAIHYANEAHAGQLYGNGKPYTWHLRAVAENGLKWIAYLPHGCKQEVAIIALWLHDTKEDCGKEHAELAFNFGEEIADVVEGMTDEPGATRAERKPNTWAKARRMGPIVVFDKLMDFLSNVEAGGKEDMYRKEFPAMKSIMYLPGEMDPIWEYAESLLFPAKH